MKKPNKKGLKCPSAIPSKSSDLFGIVNNDGIVSYLKTPLKVGAKFLETVSENLSPDTKFRFTSKCIESGCNHWNNKSSVCTLTKNIVSKFKQTSNSLQYCPIREFCRWFDQEGEKACVGCSFVRRTY